MFVSCCVCVYTCIYVQMHIYIYVCIYIYISTYVYICLHMSIYVYIYICIMSMCLCMYIYIYESGQHNYASFCKPQLGVSCLKMCIYMYVYIYTYIYVYIYMYIYMHIHIIIIIIIILIIYIYICVCVCIHVSIFFCANYIPTLGTRLAPSSRHTRRPRRRWTKCRADCMAQQPGSGPPKKRNGSNDSNVAEKILHCQNIVLG